MRRSFLQLQKSLFRNTLPLLISQAAMNRAALGRQKIHELWLSNTPLPEGDEAGGGATAPGHEYVQKLRDHHVARLDKICALLDDLYLGPQGPPPAAGAKAPSSSSSSSFLDRDQDCSAALGEAFDRLLIMLVPLQGHKKANQYLQRLLDLAGRNDISISLRTIQHMFARCSHYGEALMIFHTMRKSKLAMKMETYHAMIYCLQRLEEEAWSKRFRDEMDEKTRKALLSAENKRGSDNNGPVVAEVGVSACPLTSQVMDFIVDGCDNQLLPEKKPWLGRVLFDDAEGGDLVKGHRGEDGMYFNEKTGEKLMSEEQIYDAANNLWVQRYKKGIKIPNLQ